MSDTSRYLGLKQQPQDMMLSQITQLTDILPVTLQNTLPVNVIVTQERQSPQLIATLGRLSPRGTFEIPQGVLQSGDLLHFQYETPSGDRYFVTPSMTYLSQHGSIKIGSIAASNGGWNRDTHPNGDVSSIRIRNMLPWPIFVYYNGAQVAWIQANATLGGSEHGNVLAAPSIYFDNKNMGLKLGDVFQLQIDNTKISYLPKTLYGFGIHDRNVSEIIVGQGNVQVGRSEKPSNFSYNLGSNGQFPRTHNAVGTDDHRSSMPRSRVPVANYKALSGANVTAI